MMAEPEATRYGLALHTTSPQFGLALSDGVGTPRSRVWDLGRELSVHMHRLLAEFLPPQTWQDLAFLAVANGPGSFTGTRIGVTAARVLAQQLDIPLFSLSALAAFLQMTVADAAPNELVAIQLPARRQQVFAAIYRRSSDGRTWQTWRTETAIAPEQWQQELAAIAPPIRLLEAPENLGDTVTGLLELARWEWAQGTRSHWSDAVPFYGQHPVET
ncbi:universal bacterial protein YeaZ [Rubidibacter lacunae KORDI 51-2]|uniref:Universal bacterial protein YeaZ n=1 Tax=Rubidibacter lacunae KORDI 51-2 TaxID=582515 RepID=U5DKB5_9CHRO|nr:tRNA (adenosine(37)-N6)-threonylcarbamoyltransferase complex dimerization subunit type 1 TsaB [Rubidibacter lacunae]ERN40130.1 universal bacterial protein YeaZ [Rubidibacter lacunae KORDI 51-2]